MSSMISGLRTSARLLLMSAIDSSGESVVVAMLIYDGLKLFEKFRKVYGREEVAAVADNVFVDSESWERPRHAHPAKISQDISDHVVVKIKNIVDVLLLILIMSDDSTIHL